MNLCKRHLILFFVYGIAGNLHACDNILAPFDYFQTRFLSEVGISHADALLYFNLVPLRCRRDMDAGSYAQMRVEAGS